MPVVPHDHHIPQPVSQLARPRPAHLRPARNSFGVKPLTGDDLSAVLGAALGARAVGLPRVAALLATATISASTTATTSASTTNVAVDWATSSTSTSLQIALNLSRGLPFTTGV